MLKSKLRARNDYSNGKSSRLYLHWDFKEVKGSWGAACVPQVVSDSANFQYVTGEWEQGCDIYLCVSYRYIISKSV